MSTRGLRSGFGGLIQRLRLSVSSGLSDVRIASGDSDAWWAGPKLRMRTSSHRVVSVWIGSEVLCRAKGAVNLAGG